MDKSINKHGVLHQTKNNDEIDLILEELKNKGYFILKNVLDKKKISSFKNSLKKIYLEQIEELGSEKKLNKIKEKDIIRAPLLYDKTFLNVALLPIIKRICKKNFDKEFLLLSQIGLINKKNKNNVHKWHRDLNYQHFVSRAPLSISFIVCLDNFTKKNGGTYVIEGSHKLEKFPSNDYVLNNQKSITANKGDIILLDSMIFHRTGKNYTNSTRSCVVQVYSIPLFRQAINISKGLKNIRKLKKEDKVILGFNYNHEPSNSVKNWRQERLNKI